MDKVAPYDQLGVTPAPDWQNANPSAGQKGSIINATVFNALQNEMLGIQDAAGMTRNAADYTQVLRAIRGGKLEYYIDGAPFSGTAAPTPVAGAPAILPNPAHTSLFEGLHVRVKMGSSCTGPTPLSVSGMGAPIKRLGGLALAGGEWATGDVVDVVMTSGAFQICGLTRSDIAAVQRPITPYAGSVNGGGFYSLDLTATQVFTLPNPATLASGWYCDLLVLNSPSGYQTAYAQIATGAGSTNFTYRGLAHAPFYLIGGGEVLRFLWTGSIFLVEVLGQPAQALQYRCGNLGGSGSQGGTGGLQYLPITGAQAAGTPNLFSTSQVAASLAVPCSGYYLVTAETSVINGSASYQQAQILVAPDTSGNSYFAYTYVSASSAAAIWGQASNNIFLKQGQSVAAVIRAPSGMNFIPSADVFNVLLVQR